MANNDFPLYNGVAPSWADMVCRVQGLDASLIELEDLQAINTSSTVEVGMQRKGGRPNRTTTGQLSNEASLTFYRTGFEKFVSGLASAADAKGLTRGPQKRVSLVAFNLQYLHTPPGTDDIYEVQLNGCRYLARTLNGSEGTDADLVEVALNVKEIVDVIGGEPIVLL